jgi:acylphosphatase
MVIKAYKVRIYGDVQGVGFRARVKHFADLYKVHGYVRNLPDGSVEIHVEGDDQNVNIFLEVIKSLKDYEIWDIVIENSVVKGYEDFYIVP